MSGLALVAHQFRYDQKAFWRNPAAGLLHGDVPGRRPADPRDRLHGDQTIESTVGVEATTYYVPAIITLAVISATTQSLAISLIRSTARWAC